MFVTFFCKREKHTDCPAEWPTNEVCGPDEDCSFDIKMVKCECTCHHHHRHQQEKRDIGSSGSGSSTGGGSGGGGDICDWPPS